MEYQDQTLTCRDCGNTFTWTAGEQDFYATKGLSAPTRCKECRAKKRAERDSQRGGGGQMYDIVCAQCGKPGQVPFPPKRDDVLCGECFNARRNQGAGSDSGSDAGASDASTDMPKAA
ncbi:zinc-ribbon domain containing protein [Candidatus Berkelbacteria bacterium]|nr:zinc-ribbon domain containing protein [Candidatus Berkelbacteria bacterium]